MRTVLVTCVLCSLVGQLVLALPSPQNRVFVLQPRTNGYVYAPSWMFLFFSDLLYADCPSVKARIQNNPSSFIKDYWITTWCSVYFTPYGCGQIIQDMKQNDSCTVKEVAIFINEICQCGGTVDPINGGWSPWADSVVSFCTTSCGNGTERYVRTRECNNPPAQFGGEDCTGPDTEGPFTRVCVSTETCTGGTPGGWSAWVETVMSSCSASCGNGKWLVRKRRECNNPTPSSGGSTCQGANIVDEEQDCNVQDCSTPVHGQWGAWVEGAPGNCSEPCGGGNRTRTDTRECNSPTPDFGGNPCDGSHTRTVSEDCNPQSCPVHGQWGAWVEGTPSSCSEPCGGGNRTRTDTRECKNPQPQFGGNPCDGSHTRTVSEDCNPQSCPVHGGWGAWVEGTPGNCSVPCGAGNRTRTDTRECNNPTPQSGGNNCDGTNTRTVSEDCNPQSCPVHGGWGAWVEGTPGNCSVPCGGGNRTRTDTRECSNPTPQFGGNPCDGSNTQTVSEDCNPQPCPVHGQWGAWVEGAPGNCSEPCGGGNRTRTDTRECNNPTPQFDGNDCDGLPTQTVSEDCNPQPCPVNGNWGSWTEVAVTECTVTCGGGRRTYDRTRVCDNPKESNGGLPCQGDAGETIERTCNEEPLCPVDGEWGAWQQGVPEECSVPCGGGSQIRTDTRECNSPRPANNGSDCSGERTRDVNVTCNTQDCIDPPQNGSWSEWFDVPTEECNVTCGGGRQLVNRTRTCTNPPPTNGGLSCSGDSTDGVYEVGCNIDKCTQPPCLTSRIIGGSDVLTACKYPFMVGVRFNGNYICGGTLIRPNLVLTAAHCVQYLSPEGVQVEVGKHCSSTRNSPSYNSRNPNMEVMNVIGVAIHKDFDYTLFLNDIAVLKLEKDAIITECRDFIPLADSSTVIQTGRTCTVIGWGYIDNSRNVAQVLQEVGLELFDSPQCRATFVHREIYIQDTILCAANGDGSIGGEDACQGDSGGPLICLDNGQWVQYGIISSGFDCARPNEPGLYTKLSAFREWIDEQFV